MTRRTNRKNKFTIITLSLFLLILVTGMVIKPLSMVSAADTDGFEILEQWVDEVARGGLDMRKNAEVYDYDNRMYKINLSASSELRAAEPDVNLMLVTDRSNSMLFPSSLLPWGGDSVGDYCSRRFLNSGEVMNCLQRYQNPEADLYVIGSRPNSVDATVFILKYFPGDREWKFEDASSYAHGDVDSFRSVRDRIDTLNGEIVLYQNDGHTIYNILDKSLYYAENPINRLDLLKGSINIVANTLYDVDPRANIGLLTFARNSDTNVRYYNSANRDQLLNAVNNIETDGGTNQEEALRIVNQYWDTAPHVRRNIVVLITDGAPNATVEGHQVSWSSINNEATRLKEKGIELYTVGVSLANVDGAEEALRTIATSPDKALMAERSEEFQKAMISLLEDILSPATLYGSVRDAIDKKFYPVKEDGSAIQDGETYLGGNWSEEPDGSWSVVWDNQAISPKTDTGEGWTKSFLVKAREDFLGGNAINTNSYFMATCHAYQVNGEMYALDYPISADSPSPKVNVKSLELTESHSDITVKLGDSVNIIDALKSLYDNIYVQTIVTSFDGSAKNTGSLDPDHSIDHENDFKLSSIAPMSNEEWADLVLSLGAHDGALGYIVKEYNAYDYVSGRIEISFYQETADGEEGIYTESGAIAGEHATSVVGQDVENYVIRVDFIPDIHSADPPAVGESAAIASSINTHTVNVTPLDAPTPDNPIPNPDSPQTFDSFQIIVSSGSLFTAALGVLIFGKIRAKRK